MSIRLRLNLIFTATMAVALAVGLYGVSGLRSTQSAVESAYRRQVHLSEAQKIEADLLRGAAAIRRFVSSKADDLDEAKSVGIDIDARLLELAASASSQDELRFTGALLQDLKIYRQSIERAEFCRKKNQHDYALKIVGHLEREILPDVQQHVDQLVAYNRTIALEEAVAVQERTTTTSWTLGLFLFGLGLTGVALFFALQLWLVRPLEQLAEGARRISRGEYDAEIATPTTRELRELSQELSTMGRSIASYQGELLERERLAALGEMTYTVAHNVRNPLASIRALAQSSLPDIENKVGRAALKSIMTSVDGLDRWLKDLLIGLRPIKLTRQSEDFNQVVREVAESMSHYAEQRGVSIDVTLPDGPSEVELDRRRFDQALISVVSNAIEASPRGERIRLTSKTCRGISNGVEVTVEDHGVGIAPDVRMKIFKPSFTTKQGGTGMGLSLAQRIVVGHEGRVDVESELGSGTRFRLFIPKTEPGSMKQEKRESSWRKS